MRGDAYALSPTNRGAGGELLPYAFSPADRGAGGELLPYGYTFDARSELQRQLGGLLAFTYRRRKFVGFGVLPCDDFP